MNSTTTTLCSIRHYHTIKNAATLYTTLLFFCSFDNSIIFFNEAYHTLHIRYSRLDIDSVFACRRLVAYQNELDFDLHFTVWLAPWVWALRRWDGRTFTWLHSRMSLVFRNVQPWHPPTTLSVPSQLKTLRRRFRRLLHALCNYDVAVIASNNGVRAY